MVRTERWKYTYDVLDAGDEELYDLREDPWELTNLARDRQHVPVIAEMRRLLADWMLRTENGHPVPLYFRPFWEGETPRGAAPQGDDGPVYAQ
jgi:arylsulfatase A-like enzyme